MVLKHLATACAAGSAGRQLAFPKQKFISRRKRPRLLCIAGNLHIRKENICIIALQLFFLMRKRQPVLVLAGKGLKIAVSSSRKRASFFQATKSLQDLSDVKAKTNFLTGNRIYGHVLSTLVWGWWGKQIPCAKRWSRSNQRIMLEMHCDWGMNVCNSFVVLPTNRQERETPATLHLSQENVSIPRISGYE